MSYSKTNWQNLPNTSTPINATRLNNMENGIADANGAIAVNTYSSSSTYAVGDYCIYNNILYRCKTAIATAEAFNSTKWQQIKIMEEMANTGVTVSSTEPTGNNKNKVWFKKGKNLFNENSVTKGYAMNSDGNGGASSVTNTSGFIKVRAGNYTLSYDYSSLANQTGRGYCLYNENSIYLSGNTYGPKNKTTTFTIANDGYIRFSYDKNCTNIQFEQNTTATDYETYIEPKIYTKNSNNVYEKFDVGKEINIGSQIDNNYRMNVIKGKNLFDESNYTKGYIREDGEIIASNDNYYGNAYIPIEASNYILSSGSTTTKRIAYYTEDKSFISREHFQNATSGQATIPSNARYMRISGFITDLGSTMLEVGTTATTYQPYNASINVDGDTICRKSSETYSTTEVRIGTWIDGKSLYRKVIPFSPRTDANSVAIAHNISNLGIVIQCYGRFQSDSSNRLIPQIYYNLEQQFVVYPYSITSTTIDVYYGDWFKTSGNATNCYMIIEYTKTTG